MDQTRDTKRPNGQKVCGGSSGVDLKKFCVFCFNNLPFFFVPPFQRRKGRRSLNRSPALGRAADTAKQAFPSSSHPHSAIKTWYQDGPSPEPWRKFQDLKIAFHLRTLISWPEISLCPKSPPLRRFSGFEPTSPSSESSSSASASISRLGDRDRDRVGRREEIQRRDNFWARHICGAPKVGALWGQGEKPASMFQKVARLR